MIPSEGFLIALEGGGTRSQAALADFNGNILQISHASQVNTNFVNYDDARKAVWTAVNDLLQSSGIEVKRIIYLVSALVGPKFGAEVFGDLLPDVHYFYYNERDVVFARAGFFRPHGVALVAATGATAWGVRADDGRRIVVGGWGALLGDEGSAYAVGLLGLRAAVRVYEGRISTPTQLVGAICDHFGMNLETFHNELIRLAYQKPLSRIEIAGIAPIITDLASHGDQLALKITKKVANDHTELALHAARGLFESQESFDLAIAGGLFKAGEVILGILRSRFSIEFPQARITLGHTEPAVALANLALFDLSHC